MRTRFLAAAWASCPMSCRVLASPKKRSRFSSRAKPSDGLILSKHGIVTFGDSAREAYERMIEMVTLAEDFIARHRKTAAVPVQPHNIAGESPCRADRARRLQREGRDGRGRLAAAGA